MRAGTVKRTDTCALGHQEIEQLHSSCIGPLQIVQDDDERPFRRQRLKEVANSHVEVASLKLWTNWLWLGQFWQLETHFRCNFGEIHRAIAQDMAKLLRTTHAYIGTDGISNGLIGE